MKRESFYICNNRTGKIYGSFAKIETVSKHANKMYSNSLRKGSRSMRHNDTLTVYKVGEKFEFNVVTTYHE